MKNNFNIKKIAVFSSVVALTAMISSCGNYSSTDIKKHRTKIKDLQESHKIVVNTAIKPFIEHEIELFDKKVSATFFNESLKSILPTMSKDVKYGVGVDNNIAVSLEVDGLSVAKTLHKVLKPIGLTYIRTTGGILVIKQKRLTFKAFNQPLDIVLNAMLGDIAFSVRDGAQESLQSLVSLDFKDIPIELALDRLLSQLDLQWKKESKNYIIFRDKEQLFTINFPLLQQAFSVNSSREKSSDKDEKKDGGTIASTSSKLISSGSTASLSNLTGTIEQFLTDDGKVVIHKEMGMIWVKDRATNVDRIARFLAKINESLSKSVSISGVITEVELYERNKTGINWESVSDTLTKFGANIGGTTAGVGAANFTLGWRDGNTTTKVFVDALKTFGNVKVVSRPSLRVANNAIASLVAGKNTSYVASVEATSSASKDTVFAAQLGSIQTGLNFYVLPHIISSTDAILYISPEITSLIRMKQVTNGVEAPEISVNQTQTVVPIKNGESLIIGGLMSETEKSVRGKNPVMGSIPLLGRAFQTEVSDSGVSEFSLMIKVSW